MFGPGRLHFQDQVLTFSGREEVLHQAFGLQHTPRMWASGSQKQALSKGCCIDPRSTPRDAMNARSKLTT